MNKKRISLFLIILCIQQFHCGLFQPEMKNGSIVITLKKENSEQPLEKAATTLTSVQCIVQKGTSTVYDQSLAKNNDGSFDAQINDLKPGNDYSIKLTGYSGTELIARADQGGISVTAGETTPVDMTWVPFRPILYSPQNAAPITDNTPTFDWGDVSGASMYELLVTNSNGNAVINPRTLTVSTYTATTSEALADGTYHWKVRCKDGQGNWGGWSETWGFNISSIEIKFQKTFGGSNSDYGFSVLQTQDGGFIIGATTYSYGAAGGNIWLIKTNPDGEELWNRIYGNDSGFGYAVQQTHDSGFIICGENSSYRTGGGAGDVWLIKTDINGIKEWDKTYGGVNTEFGEYVKQTYDDGFIICGRSNSFGDVHGDIWIIKTDQNGNEIWNKTYGGISSDWGYSIQQTQDQGFVICGKTESYGSGEWDILIIKTDENGNQQWSKIFGGNSSEEGHSLETTLDGGFVICGYTGSYGAGQADIWLIKTDFNGNELWNKTFGGINDDYGRSVQQTLDGGFILCGLTYSFGAGGDCWLIKTDVNGNEVWNKTFGGNNTDDGMSVIQAFDSGYIICGSTSSFGAGKSDVWLIKIK